MVRRVVVDARDILRDQHCVYRVHNLLLHRPARLNPAIVGSLLLASKIIDAFTDLGFGYILDKTHTRWGKARPYEVFVVLMWAFTILMFNVPRSICVDIHHVYARKRGLHYGAERY